MCAKKKKHTKILISYVSRKTQPPLPCISVPPLALSPWEVKSWPATVNFIVFLYSFTDYLKKKIEKPITHATCEGQPPALF